MAGVLYFPIPMPSGKRKATGIFTVSVKEPNGIEDKATFKGTTGMTRLHGCPR
jgi:hypothetical protein